MNYGLSAAPAVKWLIGAEPDLHNRIKEFIAGQCASPIEVAGPPSAADMLFAHKRRNAEIKLPVVRLHLKMVSHHLTGQPGVEVRCTDAEIDEIARWAREAQLRTALAAATPTEKYTV